MDILNKTVLNQESNDTSIDTVVENLSYMDSSIEDNLPNFNGYDLSNNKAQSNVHTPSPMVARSYFNDHKEPWKNMSIYSYSRCSDIAETDVSDSTSQRNIDTVYNVHIDNKLPLTHNWTNYKPSYSPESKRDTDIIFEEKTVNEIDGELENSDYSDQSQSPENSISSNDSTSSGSSDSSQEDTTPTNEENTNPEDNHTYRISLDQCRDFQEIFTGISKDDEFSGSRYHQPPKALDRNAAKRLARRLYECDGFKITDVAKHLSKRNDFSQIVGEEFANYFDLSNLRLDKALRLFLSKFTLTGETQERERIMHHFSKRYVVCNAEMYNCEDACHTLVCALIILNTNLHSQNQPKMSCNDFVLNLKDLNEGENFPLDNLKELYSAIEQEPIKWPMDDELVGIVNVPKQELHDFSKQRINAPFSVGLDLPRDSNCRDFMSGYVVRKWLKETGGRKAAFGKRGWKLFYGRLRDLTLYLYKDHDKSVSKSVNNNVSKHRTSLLVKRSKSVPSKPSKNTKQPGNNVSHAVTTEPVTMTTSVQSNGDHNHCSQNEDGHHDNMTQSNDNQKDTVLKEVNQSPFENNPSNDGSVSTNLVLPPADTEIHINHAFASRALDYVKKKNIFRIKTKYGSEYLFQVNTEKEMDGWIDNINYVAALLSDPEPTIGICTMEKLSSRSIPLPKITMLNVRDQLESHQKCVLELEKVIASLRENTVKRLDKRTRVELEESIRFREDELQRYKKYCQLLEFELSRMQNIVNIRLASSDPPYYYQQFQLPGSSPAAYFLNQGIVVNQQMQLIPNYSLSPDNTNTSSSSSSLAGGPPSGLVFPQSNNNLRFCGPPPLHHQNVSAMSMNRRLRYRMPPGTLLMQSPQPAAAVALQPPPPSSSSIITSSSSLSSTSLPGTETHTNDTSIIPDHLHHTINLAMDPSVLTATSPDTVPQYLSAPTVNTFYEIV